MLLDSDGIAQTLIENNWRETAARDWVGTTAGVPAADPNSFQVSAASLSGGVVTPHDRYRPSLGRWVARPPRQPDGQARSTAPPRGWSRRSWRREAAPPLLPLATTDAVVLEVWQHAVNGYQMPNTLIEPALGGPDTAERLRTSFAFRLARLDAGQTCADLAYDESWPRCPYGVPGAADRHYGRLPGGGFGRLQRI